MRQGGKQAGALRGGAAGPAHAQLHRQLHPRGHEPLSIQANTAPLYCIHTARESHFEAIGRAPVNTMSGETTVRRRRSSGRLQDDTALAALRRKGSFRGRRMSIREATLPLATTDGDDFFSLETSEFARFAPSFREEWIPLFEEDRYVHLLSTLHCFCWIPAAYFFGESLRHHADTNAATLEVAKGLVCICAGIVFAVPNLRPFCVRNVDWLGAILVSSLYALHIARPVLEDLRAREHTRGCTAAGSSDELGTYKDYSSQLRSKVFHIEFLLVALFFCHLPLAIKMRSYQCWWFAGVVLLCNIAAFLVAGHVDQGLLANLLVQLGFIIPETILMRKEETRAKQHFAYIMAIQFASAVHRDLLHTLIPPAVLTFLTDRGDADSSQHNTLLSAQAIPFCTVMFAMINYDVTTPEDFDFLGYLFSAFDEAVEQSGMFKYQHVSSGARHYFIVTCPCVSNPYKDADSESHSEYAYAKNYLDMIALGFDLMEIASKVLSSSSVDEFDKLREVPKRAHEMQIKVGISSGPAAGVVLGRCRRFYCVYGDTVNTAARMCASSRQGAVRVTAEIGGHPSVVQGSWFMSELLGKVWVKGKGDMEVYDVSLKSKTFFERTVPARKAVIVRRRVSQRNVYDETEATDESDTTTLDSGSASSRSIGSGFGSRGGGQSLPKNVVPNNEVLESWVSSVQGLAEPRTVMTLKRLRPQFSSPTHERAFQNSNTQNRKKMERLHGGFVFQLVLTLWLCHKTFTSGVSCECVGGSRLECGKSEPLGRDLIDKVVWTMVAFVAISYCLVLHVAGTLGRWFISLQNVAIRYNLMADGSLWLLKDEVSEASDLTKESNEKVSQSKVRFCEVMLGLCKFVCCYSSLIVGPLLPSQRNALIGMGIGSQQTFGLYGVSFEGSCAIVLGSYIPALAFIFLLESPSKTFMTFLGFSGEMPAQVEQDVNFWFRNYCGSFASICSAAAVWRSERMAWRREMSSRDHLNHRRTLLLDLLPSAYLRQLIKGCDYIKCSSGRAVVLQLDLCNFTVLSQQLAPEKLADVVNSLIRDFDECVLGSVGHMIKIDTIGDAYIVVNWMTSGNPSSVSDTRSNNHQQEICTLCLYLDVIIVANNILSVLARHRAMTGIDLHARIGIGAGEVISGVMGRLQPRFCVYGPAMMEAAENELQGQADKVHCTQEFFDVITNGMCATPCSAHLQHKIDGIRLVHRMVQEGKLTSGKPTEKAGVSDDCSGGHLT